MASKSPKFIVFEGIDGSGTTTQAKLLWEVMSGAHLTQEPTNKRIGSFIKQIITETPEWVFLPPTIAYLFAADRSEHLYSSGGIRDELSNGRTVICDRYTMSSFAYNNENDENLIFDLNKGFLTPDLTIFLDVPVEVAIGRIVKRGEPRSYYETQARLHSIFYRYQDTIHSIMHDESYSFLGKCVRLNGDQSAYDIHAEVLAEVNKLWDSNQ